MNFKTLVSTLLLIGSSLSQHRVIDGDIAKPFNYPFIVSIQDNDFHICGGSLLDKETVLTAAHCYTPVERLKVHVHRHNLTQSDANENGVGISVKSFKVHPQYNNKTFHNDIAIIKLVTPIENNVEIKFVELNDNKAYDDVGKISKLVGWGRYNNKLNVGSPLLRQGEFVTIGLDICQAVFNNLDILGHICVLPIKKKISGCQGDSGGPLFIQEEDNSVVQIGIVSHGAEGCNVNDGSPNVYTNVRNFLPWIIENSVSDESKKVETKNKISKMFMKVKSYFKH